MCTDTGIKMKSEYSTETIYKEVVIIGNGPSGIALSYMLSGNLPYLTSDSHPDEMLAARLAATPFGQCIIDADLAFLASDLEGRSNNPISLLLDALLHPCADVGMKIEPLVEFRKNGREIDHVVLGKGLPGGSWHKMDPEILTLSLASWMCLPGLPFESRDSGMKRAYASSVARYYVKYVEQMNLEKYFKNNVICTMVSPANEKQQTHIYDDDRNWVKKLDENDRMNACVEIDSNKNNKLKKCILSNAINYIWNRGNKKRCCKRPRDEQLLHEQSPDRKIRDIDDSSILIYDSSNSDFDRYCTNKYQNHNHIVPFYEQQQNVVNWIVETQDGETGKPITYTCRHLVLANGCNDLPNKLSILKGKEPGWLLYDLRTLEWYLDTKLDGRSTMDPVLVVGAGLSAADAVIAVRGRGVPVVHAFRSKSTDLNRQLPAKMYPEYHEVYQMMKEGRNQPFYTPYPEYTLSAVNQKNHTVTLIAKDGIEIELKVLYVIVLIGSRPDLKFLPEDVALTSKRDYPIDGKTNAINIDKMTHQVKGYENLYAVGTLAGDNFVRFIPGGALAVVADLYKKNQVNET